MLCGVEVGVGEGNREIGAKGRDDEAILGLIYIF
jgi:hypothetical protein